jgi:hypothetical protein
MFSVEGEITMAAHEVERSKWRTFFDEFTRERSGCPARVEEYGPGTLVHEVTEGLPFVGISVDSPHGNAIDVTLGTEQPDHITHTINHPTQVWLMSGSNQPEDVLEVKDADGTTLLLRFPCRA